MSKVCGTAATNAGITIYLGQSQFKSRKQLSKMIHPKKIMENEKAIRLTFTH